MHGVQSSQSPLTAQFFDRVPNDVLSLIFEEIFRQQSSLNNIYYLSKRFLQFTQLKFSFLKPFERSFRWDAFLSSAQFSERISLSSSSSLLEKIQCVDQFFTITHLHILVERFFMDLCPDKTGEELYLQIQLYRSFRKDINALYKDQTLLSRICYLTAETPFIKTSTWIEKITCLLVFNGADPNQDTQPYSPLMNLVYLGPAHKAHGALLLKMINILLENGGNPHIKIKHKNAIQFAQKNFKLAYEVFLKIQSKAI